MSYESRTYDNAHGDPVVVLVVTGTHDVSRLVNLLSGASPNCEHIQLADAVRRQVRRHNGGGAALRLLRDHGGPDFTEEPAPAAPSHRDLVRAIADPGQFLPRGEFDAEGKSDYSESIPSWSARAVVALLGHTTTPTAAEETRDA